MKNNETRKANFRFNNFIQKTSNYSIFERLQGNRSVSLARVKKIINSINKIGQIPSPIIVNEKYQVIDGQGRLEAFKQLDLPVYYMVVEGIGIDECIAMNIDQTNWKLTDYIESYAEIGNMNYIFLSKLLSSYSKFGIGIAPVIRAITNGCDVDSRIIKSGKFICTKEDYNNAVEILNYEARFKDVIEKIGGGRKDFIYSAIGFAFMCKQCDNDRLYKKMNENIRDFRRCANLKDCLEELSNIYNSRARVEMKCYLHILYETEQAAKYPWYKTRYGENI